MSTGNAGGSLRRFYIIFAVVAVVGLGAVGYSVGSKAMGGAVSEPLDMEGLDDMRLLTELAVPVTMGADDAPATVIVFEDYLCAHCSAFSLQVKPLVEETFIQTGKARLVYYDYPLNPQLGSFLAARAARCAGDQDHFWDFHGRLMRNQRSWGRAQNKIPVFEDFAEELGMDRGEFSRCLNSDRHAEEVTAKRELARALGLPGTPSVLVGTGTGMSRRLPDYSFESIREAIESLQGG
ncbi:MAG: thioredoxin domain-containing protein [Longimicrobiales bacterium]